MQSVYGCHCCSDGMSCRSAGVFTACCHVLLAVVRHRAAAVRRCMALLAASARALLRDLLRWQAPRHADVARQCAEHLSHLYEDIAERKVRALSSSSSIFAFHAYLRRQSRCKPHMWAYQGSGNRPSDHPARLAPLHF